MLTPALPAPPPAPEPSGALAVVDWSAEAAGGAELLVTVDRLAITLPGGLEVVARSPGGPDEAAALAGARLRLRTDPTPPRAPLPRVDVFGARGEVVASVVGPATSDQVHDALWEGVAARRDLTGRGGPGPLVRAETHYPSAARWLGAPEATCLARVMVSARGAVEHSVVEACPEPFASATRRSLERWRFEPREGVGLVRILFQPDGGRLLPSPEGCFWSSRVERDGTHSEVVSDCAAGAVRPGPLPWSERAVADVEHVASFTIRNARRPIPCEVVLEVSAAGVDASLDPVTCPAVVRADAVAAVRSWPWALGPGDRPIRVVLGFVPPTDP